MCEQLAGMSEAMRRYAASFDAAALSAEQAQAALAEATAIERMAATVKALAAARVADGGLWKAAGERSAAHALARSTGTSVSQASETLATAKRLEKLPAVGAAARGGQLSAGQAAAVADAAAADPASEQRLLEKARRSSLAELPAPKRRHYRRPRPAGGLSTATGSCAPTSMPRAPGTC